MVESLTANEPRHRMKTASDGLRWHVVEGGTGPTIVLVAGFPQTVYAWRRVIPLLASRWHVIAVDLPGQGDSEKPESGYDTWTTAGRLHTLLTTMNEDRYFLVGHDIGSWVSFPFAHRFPKNLDAVALVDGNIAGLSLPSSIEIGPDSWRNWHFLFNAIPDLPETLFGGHERDLIEWFFLRKTASWRETFTHEDVDEYVRALASPGGIRGILGYYRAVAENFACNNELKKTRINVPVLALGGEFGSAPNIFEDSRELANDVRGGVIQGSGHYVPEEKPTEFVEALNSFADELAAPQER